MFSHTPISKFRQLHIVFKKLLAKVEKINYNVFKLRKDYLIMAKIRLKNILELSSYMKILIDENVEMDENGNYLINVAYERVSTDRQADLGFGLDIQEKDIMNYATSNQLKNLVVFIDDGHTGTTMDRPALNGITRMIRDFNDGKIHIRINTMIIPKIDRLGRTLLGTLQFIQDYIVSSRDSKGSLINKNKDDINFISVAENYCRIERNNPQGKFLLMLFASLAEFDRDLIVEKLKKGRLERVASGKWMGGGIPPYGYKYDKEQGKLVVVPEEAENVKEIFRLYIEEKMPPAKIADRLHLKNERLVINILKRKTSAGYIIYNDVEYKGEHDPIISLERWEEAQDEMELRSVLRSESNYLLTGLLYCGECGAKLRYQKWDKKTGECKLICYSQQSSKPSLVKDENCDNQKYWQSDIENAVISELFKLTYLGSSAKKSAPAFDPIAALNEELKKEMRKLSKLYDFEDDAEDGEDDVLKDKILNTRKRITELKAQIESEREQEKIKRKVKRAKEIFRSLESTWEHMTQKEKQAVCQELIHKVIVYKDCTVDVHLKLKSYLINK